MSADFVLRAAPNDAAWLTAYSSLVNAEGQYDQYRTLVDDLPWCWIGQVSWLKVGLSGDGERYIPGPVGAVAALVDGMPVLTAGRAKAIATAMNVPNTSSYGRRHAYYSQRVRGGRGVKVYGGRNGRLYCGVARRRYVKNWLAGHLGCVLIYESW